MTGPDADMIEGVKVKPLRLLPNERGRLMEIQRADDPDFPGFGQVYVTQSFDGVVKAWYRHARQIDQLAAIIGTVRLALFDSRTESPTAGRVQEVMMGERSPRLVTIPPGVWHGFKAVDGDAFLVHLNSRPFDFDDVDEERLSADDPSIPYSW